MIKYIFFSLIISFSAFSQSNPAAKYSYVKSSDDPGKYFVKVDALEDSICVHDSSDNFKVILSIEGRFAYPWQIHLSKEGKLVVEHYIKTEEDFDNGNPIITIYSKRNKYPVRANAVVDSVPHRGFFATSYLPVLGDKKTRIRTRLELEKDFKIKVDDKFKGEEFVVLWNRLGDMHIISALTGKICHTVKKKNGEAKNEVGSSLFQK